MKSIFTNRYLWFCFVLFAVLLCWFYFANPWYPASQLVISGSAPGKENGRITVRWDSGHGLNGYEMRRFNLKQSPVYDGGECEVKVEKSGSGPMGSRKSEVILQNLSEDGKNVIYKAASTVKRTMLKNEVIRLKDLNDSKSFLLNPRHHLRFDFITYNFAGDANIDICGEEESVYLYTSNEINQWSLENSKRIDKWYIAEDNSYSITVDLPRYRINNFLFQIPDGFSVDDVKIINEFGEIISLVAPIKADIGLIYQLGDRDKERQHLFHQHRFFWQCVFALLTMFIICYLIRVVSEYTSFQSILYEKKRWFFWSMFFTAMLIYAFWHIAFWPGIASTDSLKIWRAAQIPGTYLGDHPPLNVIFYMYLSMLWNNMAVVPLFQNIICSVLISYIFFSIFRWGVPILLVCFFYLLTICSVPVGMYNSVLWKDVPFAFAVVFLAYRLAVLYFERRYEGRRPCLQDWLKIGGLMIMIIGMRYNGAIYLLVVPIMIVLLGLVRLRWRYLWLIIPFFIIAGGSVFIIPKLNPSASFVSMQVSRYVNRALGDLSPKYLTEKFDKYSGVFDVNQEEMQWDHLHSCFWWRYNNNFLTRVKWNDVYPYLSLSKTGIQKKISNLAVKIYQISYKPPWVFLSWNPVYLLYLLLIIPLLIRWMPMSAVFSIILLSQMGALVFLGILNWRYYYFAYFGLMFLIPLMFADRARREAV